jgi:hypothetical protein
MTREFLQRIFEELCRQSRMPMDSAERQNLRRMRTAVATELAFWDERHPPK